jgi:16S rRNA C967 or C1407 C5-methylase (RsmB/RsmF family)
MNELTDRYKVLCEENGLSFEFKKPKLKKTFWINTNRVDEKKLIKRLKGKGFLLNKIGNYYESIKEPFSIASSTEHLVGDIFLQKITSLIAVESLELNNQKEEVLDACSAPGGKSLLISLKSKVLAIENNGRRINRILKNQDRMVLNNLELIKKDFLMFESNKKFKRILIDAPCSGNYANDEKWFEKRKISDFEKNAKTQLMMIKHALKLLDKDGFIIYSTCSLEPEENELVLNSLLENELIKLDEINLPEELNFGEKGFVNVFGKKLNEDIKKTKRFLPWINNTEGFFIAKLRKN